MRKVILAALLAIIFLPLGHLAPAKASLAIRDVLIKGPNSTAVYYFAEDGKRYVFTNDRVYSSWFKDFSNVVNVTADELASVPLGKNITYRPGVKMVKITTDPKVYAVDKGGNLRWVTSEQVAIALYGADWNKKIDDVPDAFFFDYKIGEPIYFATDFSPAGVTGSVMTINADKNLPTSFSPRQADSQTTGNMTSGFGFTDRQPLSKQEIISKGRVSTAYIRTTDGAGSGVVIEADGTILTNAHVVEGVNSASVYLPTKGTFTATVLGRDESLDLAVIKIASNEPLPYLQFGQSSVLVPGDDLFALGFPLSFDTGFQTDPNFQEGSFSRSVLFDDGYDYIETTAQILPGNSGGPLLNVFGELIGINSFLISDPQYQSGALRYAIPSNRAKFFAPLLKQGRNVTDGPTVPVTPTPNPACTADTWSCTSWSSCSASGNQTRSCSMTVDCPNVNTPSPETVQACSIPVPPGPAALNISLGSNPVSQSFVKGTSGVDFLGINLVASESTVTVTGLTAVGWIDADGGNSMVQGFDDNIDDAAVSDIINQCRLMDGATMLGNAKVPTPSTTEGVGGLLEFSGFNLSINAGQTKSLKINCDISNLAFDGGDPESIAFSVIGSQVTAKNANNATVNPTGTANQSALTTRHAITGTGTLSYLVAPDDTESEAGLVIANTTAVLGKIRVTAQNEEMKQTKLRVSLVNAAQNSVVSMSLYDGATLVAGPVPLSGQNADFSGFNFVVPKDGSKTLTVKAVLNSVSNGATSGADLQIVADTATPVAGTFEYRGTSSSTVVTTQGGTDVTGRNKVLRKTKPTVSLAALPTSTLSNGTMVLGRVTITADSAEQVSVKSVRWTVTKSDSEINLTNSTGQAAMREIGQGSHIAGAAMMGTGCAASGGTDCTVTSTFASEQVIAAGTSKSYEIVLSIASANANDSVSTNIQTDSSSVTGSLTSNSVAGDSIGGTIYNFQWSDNSGLPHNDSIGGSADWSNGKYVKVLPTDTQTVLFP